MKEELQRGTAISIRGLTKRYPDNTVANRGIDLDVYEGEVLSILGPNGAGKTTLVRQITTELSKVLCLKCRRKAFRRKHWRPLRIGNSCDQGTPAGGEPNRSGRRVAAVGGAGATLPSRAHG
jgi:hypothetical protein